MTPDQITKMRLLWSNYLDQLRVAGDHLFRPDTPADEITLAEGLRHLSRMTRLGLLAQLEYSDLDFPVLAQYVDPVTKFGCDNPDTIYLRAILNGSLRYRIVGKRNSIDYLSFITARPGENGRQHQIGHLDSKGLTVDAQGNFEIILSPEREGDNWLLLTTDTQSVSVRQTFLDRKQEQAADLRIERLGEAAQPAPLTLAKVEQGLAGAAAYTNYITKLFPDWTHGYLSHVNALPPADQEACLRAGGDPNIYFYRSVWRLAPEEALVVRIPRIPDCDTWNLQVDNFWQESMDHRYHHSSLNRHTAVYEPDGSMVAIIAHENPGHPNWLDTAGHDTGHFAMRWIRAVEHVDPETRLVSLEEARNLSRAREVAA